MSLLVDLSTGSTNWGRAGSGATDTGKVALFDSTGRELIPVSAGSYLTAFETRHTGAPAAGATVFNMRGPTSKTARIRRIFGFIGFDGTFTAATTLRYGFYRGSGNASPSGGTARTSSTGKKRGSTNWTAQDIRFDLTGAGLTTTGITYEADPLLVIGLPLTTRISTGSTAIDTTAPLHHFDWALRDAGDRDSPLDLTANDHFAIRVQTVAAIIGLTIMGSIEWDEV